jgi:hypothetical protein
MSYILQNIKHPFLTLALSFLFSCTNSPGNGQFALLEKLINNGSFLEAGQFIDSLKVQDGTTAVQLEKLDSLKQIMHRIRLDFTMGEKEVKKQLANYFELLDDSLILDWEESGKLEMKRIDGQKRYFRNAVSNLFRLDTEAAKQKIKVDGKQPDQLELFRLEHTAEVIRATAQSGQPVLSQEMVLTYSVQVKANAVPNGETIHCWLPAPREGNARQKNFRLLASDPENVKLAPNDYLQRTFYLKKKAVQNQPANFSVQFAVQTSAQYFNLKPEDIKAYDTSSETFRKYTAERPPHLVFSPTIKALAAKIVDGETNPLRKVEKIYHWISDTIPWASALEYSIIPNIPDYVLTYGHGDCGMQTLLFMGLARSQGIPVKWQSGFMLHPGHVNLHDWCEVYYEGPGWVPLDQSFKLQNSEDKQVREFYIHGIDSYRLIVNDDYGQELYPPKKHLRSEPYDFQRGEVEWEGGNLYFDQWSWNLEVEYDL